MEEVIQSGLCSDRVVDFVRGVVAYHKLCNIGHYEEPVLTLKMAELVLPQYSPKEVEACIRHLDQEGRIAIIREAPLSFMAKNL